MAYSLRPDEPLRVLILLATAGGGHQSVARALVEAIDQMSAASAQVGLLDVYQPSCSRFPVTMLPRLYSWSLTHSPQVFGAVHAALEDSRRFAAFERVLLGCAQPGLRTQLRRYRPDVVVRVVPGFGRSVSAALAAIGSPARIVTVVTDLLTVHPAWLSGTSDAYIVPSTEAADACRGAGVPPERIHCFGLPVQANDDGSSRCALRRQLGLEPHRPTILLMSGAEGGGRLEDQATAIVRRCADAQVVVMCGRNTRLLTRLSTNPPARTCTVLGHIDGGARWIRASDLLVTKAGPSTVMEAIHAGVPMILSDSLPQERRTEVYLRAHGAAEVAADPLEVAAIAARLLNSPQELDKLRRAGAGLRRPHAAMDAAKLVLQTAASSRVECGVR